MLQFFENNCLIPNWNANTMILIPKTSENDKIEHYRSIVFANFKFKIITNVGLPPF